MGRVGEALAGAGVAGDTVTMFTSDNGFLMAEHGLTEKWLMYEGSLRVPGFVHDPAQAGSPAHDRAGHHHRLLGDDARLRRARQARRR